MEYHTQIIIHQSSFQSIEYKSFPPCVVPRSKRNAQLRKGRHSSSLREVCSPHSYTQAKTLMYNFHKIWISTCQYATLVQHQLTIPSAKVAYHYLEEWFFSPKAMACPNLTFFDASVATLAFSLFQWGASLGRSGKWAEIWSG